MSKKILLSKNLQYYAENRDAINVEGDTLGDCLNNLTDAIPKIKNIIFSSDGKVFSFVEIMINCESVDQVNLTQSIRQDDEISINIVPRC